MTFWIKNASGAVLAKINAETAERAAEKYARQQSPNAVAKRVTGMRNRSGKFRPYRPSGNNLRLIGEEFHVSKLEQ